MKTEITTNSRPVNFAIHYLSKLSEGDLANVLIYGSEKIKTDKPGVTDANYTHQYRDIIETPLDGVAIVNEIIHCIGPMFKTDMVNIGDVISLYDENMNETKYLINGFNVTRTAINV